MGTSGTLTLATPAALASLNVLDTDGNGAATFTATLNFVGGGSVVLGAQTAYDNFVPGSPNTTAIEGMGRVNHNNYADNSDFFNTPGAPLLYENDFTVPTADQGLLVQSITFSTDATGTTQTNIFAVSGETVTQEPGQQYANNVVVNPASYADTINVANGSALTAGMGTLTLNASTLNVTSDDTSGNPYSLAFGNTTINGPAALNMNNSTGGGAATVTLGALSGAGTLSVSGPGTLSLPTVGNLSGGLTINSGLVIAGTAGA